MPNSVDRQKQSKDSCHSCLSALSRTAAALILIYRSSAMMTNGYLSWNGQRHVEIILLGEDWQTFIPDLSSELLVYLIIQRQVNRQSYSFLSFFNYLMTYHKQPNILAN